MLFSRSKFHNALLQARDVNVDLCKVLEATRQKGPKTAAEAKAICQLLQSLPLPTSSAGRSRSSRLHTLVGLFQQPETEEAFIAMGQHGIPELCRIYDQPAETRDEDTRNDMLFLLKVLAMYRTEAGTDRVIAAARKPFCPDSYMWSVILGQYKKKHPQVSRVLKELGDPLPQGFIAVALMDTATGCAIAGEDIEHPFNTPAGIARLRQWLTSEDEAQYSYAHSAAATLPFISRPARDELLALALDHPEVDVQLEAAWASSKVGSEAGIKTLARYCLDVNHSRTACQYLSELGREDAIPDEARASDFQARGEFAQWLAHPNELGRAPDDVQIVDHRELLWPPDRQSKSLWLIKYQAQDRTGLGQDDVGCGVVGSVTFCLFSYKMAQRPPEDAYAIHCFWEMESSKLIHEVPVEELAPQQFLRDWTGDPLAQPELVDAVTFAPELNYPGQTVVLASAKLKGEQGWVVLDGPRSTWYPKRDMPDGSQKTVLMVHVGRTLLGFKTQPDRQAFLRDDRAKREPQQIVGAYERLLTEASGGVKTGKHTGNLEGLLRTHFNAYIEAKAILTGQSKPSLQIQTYETLLAAARASDESGRGKLLGSFGPLGEQFDEYVAGLIATGQSARVKPLIDELAPVWNHNYGYGQLGAAAFHCGDHDTAEYYFLKLRASMQDWRRSETMDLLAEIWAKRGHLEQSQSLLIECLKHVLEESKTAKGSDRKLYEQWFQSHRSAYLRLFPEKGAATLAAYGIPTTTLP